MQMNVMTGQAAKAADDALKRKAPDIGNTELRSVRYKDKNGRFKEEYMQPSAKMQPSYELQLEIEEGDILQRRREEEEFRRFTLRRLVVSFTSRVSARLVSGVVRSGHDKEAEGVQKYLQSPDNLAKVVSFLSNAKLSGEPNDFAVALDKNYNQRNDAAHATADGFLEETAAQLKKMGALRLLGKELPWQCALIEYFEHVKKDLFA